VNSRSSAYNGTVESEFGGSEEIPWNTTVFKGFFYLLLREDNILPYSTFLGFPVCPPPLTSGGKSECSFSSRSVPFLTVSNGRGKSSAVYILFINSDYRVIENTCFYKLIAVVPVIARCAPCGRSEPLITLVYMVKCAEAVMAVTKECQRYCMFTLFNAVNLKAIRREYDSAFTLAVK